MDEVEFKRAYENLRVLVDHVGSNDAWHVNVRNAFLTVMAMLDSLNQRITEMQLEEDDE